MDPLYALSTSRQEAQRAEDNFQEVLGSCKSLSRYEKRNFKNLLPQISATIVVASFHVVVGISLVYPAILVPQLQESKEFEVTADDASWIASIMALTTPIGTIMAGFLMDRFGRVNTVKLAVIPGIGGWLVIALANNVSMIMVGRILTSLATAFGSSPAVVYITEIARVDMRGSLISFLPALTSLGMVINYLKGWFMTWRQVAWSCTIYTLIPCILVFFIPESPPWLVSRNRIAEAKKSLTWINRYQPQPEGKAETFAGLQLALLQKDQERKMLENSRSDSGLLVKARGFLEPTGYKPLFILVGLFFFQRFSGVFTFLFYSISFLQEIGTTFNPYLASVIIGLVRMVMSMINTYVLKNSRRRPLMFISCVGTAFFISTSALFTSWIKQGTTTMTWVPVVLLLFFIVTSMIGLVPIPVTMMAELFPLEIRGVAYSVANGLGNIVMFASLKSYPLLLDTFGGIVGIQYFFAVVSLVAIVYIYIFLPETHNKKLRDIEEYFKHNIVYLAQKSKSQKSPENGGRNPAEGDQDESLVQKV